MWTRTTRIKRLLTLALVAGMAVGFVWGSAYAADGDLDPTFDGDGRVTTDFHNTLDEAHAMAIQPDGKIVAVGTTHISGNNYNFSVARYNVDGSLDTTFGGGDGKLTTDFAGGDDGANAVAIQSDGKIVVAGYAGRANFAVVRYHPDGSLDSSFDQDGRADYDIYWDMAYGIALQDDGKLVLVGSTYQDDPTDFAILRLSSDGSLDGGFDSDGQVTMDFFGGADEARAVVIRHDGKIIIAGFAQVSGSNYDFALARFNPDGSLDTTFDGDGKVTRDFFDADDKAYAVGILPADGRIVVAGANWLDCCGYNFAVARFHADGRVDLTFDLDGIQTVNFADGTAEEVGLGMALQADRKIVVAGYAPGEGGVNDFALLRLHEDGSLDGSFGNGGRMTHDFGGGVALAYDVAVQLDGRIVAAGTAYMGDTNHYDVAVARYVLGDLPTPVPPTLYYMPLLLK